jgi:hypothetical protein
MYSPQPDILPHSKLSSLFQTSHICSYSFTHSSLRGRSISLHSLWFDPTKESEVNDAFLDDKILSITIKNIWDNS